MPTAQPGNGSEQSGCDPPHARHQRNHPHYAQHRKRTSGRYQGNGDHRKVKNTPRIPEEIPAMSNNPCGDLDGKYPEQHPVGHQQPVPSPGFD